MRFDTELERIMRTYLCGWHHGTGTDYRTDGGIVEVPPPMDYDGRIHAKEMPSVSLPGNCTPQHTMTLHAGQAGHVRRSRQERQISG